MLGLSDNDLDADHFLSIRPCNQALQLDRATSIFRICVHDRYSSIVLVVTAGIDVLCGRLTAACIEVCGQLKEPSLEKHCK